MTRRKLLKKVNGRQNMKTVILADKYSKDTIKEIINVYKKQGFNEFIICRTSINENIEEYEENGCTIIEAKLSKNYKSGGQILKIANLLEDTQPFFLTYGDYLCSIDLNNFLNFHKNQGRVLSMAVIKEKNKQIFGGFMILDYDAIGYIENERVLFEREPLIRMAEEDEVGWYSFSGNYQIMYRHMKIYGF